MSKTLYYGGSILTMNKKMPRTQALLTENGKITAVGDYAKLDITAKDAKRVDLCGKTLMPGFVDGHSHLAGVGASLKKCDLSACRSFDEILDTIRKYRTDNDLTHGEIINCAGYDTALLKEGTHPTAKLLDSLGFDNPIGCSHISLHMGVYNTNAMRLCGVDDSYSPTAGGVVGRDSEGHLTGYFEEGTRGKLSAVMEKLSEAEVEDCIIKAQDYYLKYGITTMQDGGGNGDLRIRLYERLAKEGKLKGDVVIYMAPRPKDPNMWEDAKKRIGNGGYMNHLKIGGIKTVLDGSPQARTAWMRKPYEGGDPNYCGYPLTTDERLYPILENAIAKGVQVLAHCNGDAAAEQFLSNWEKAVAAAGHGAELRPVMIHAQTVGYDQLDRMGAVGMMPSFFIGHCYYWGDTHLKNFGERGQRISPVKAAMERGLPYDFHQDSPVTPPDMLHSVWCAVNRITRNGICVGPENRIDVYDALIGVTNGAAYSYFEEDTKGILKEGAVADLVILDKDPTAIDPMEIKNIKVLSTIKEGETLYTAE